MVWGIKAIFGWIYKNTEGSGNKYATDFTINGQIYNSKSYLICGTADLPAKSLVMNCNQFNGQNSCVHSGETFRTVKGVQCEHFLMTAPSLNQERELHRNV